MKLRKPPCAWLPAASAAGPALPRVPRRCAVGGGVRILWAEAPGLPGAHQPPRRWSRRRVPGSGSGGRSRPGTSSWSRPCGAGTLNTQAAPEKPCQALAVAPPCAGACWHLGWGSGTPCPRCRAARGAESLGGQPRSEAPSGSAPSFPRGPARSRSVLAGRWGLALPCRSGRGRGRDPGCVGCIGPRGLQPLPAARLSLWAPVRPGLPQPREAAVSPTGSADVR